MVIGLNPRLLFSIFPKPKYVSGHSEQLYFLTQSKTSSHRTNRRICHPNLKTKDAVSIEY